MKQKRYEEYKNSGVECISEVPIHWAVKRLKFISPQISVGLVINPSTYFSETGTVPMITGRHIKEMAIDPTGADLISEKDNLILEKTRIFTGDIVSIRVGYPGVTAVVPSTLNGINCASLVIIRRGNYNSTFLSYCFNSIWGKSQIEVVSYGAAQKCFNIGDALEFRFPVPPRKEQDTVAAFLDEKTALIDSTIRKKEKLIELLQEERTAIINQAVTRGLDPNVKMKDSGVEWLGEIPEHWETYRLKYVAEANPSNIDKKSIEGEQSVFLCNYVDVYKNEFITGDLAFMKATATEDQIKRFTLKKGDVLATKDSEDPSDIAVPAAVKDNLTGVVCGYHLTHIRPNESMLDGFYLHRLFQAYSFNQQFTVKANGVTRYGLPSSAFTEAVVCCPPLNEQKDIVKFLIIKTGLIDDSVKNYLQQISFLMEYRTALINEVVTGQRCVI